PAEGRGCSQREQRHRALRRRSTEGYSTVSSSISRDRTPESSTSQLVLDEPAPASVVSESIRKREERREEQSLADATLMDAAAALDGASAAARGALATEAALTEALE